MHEHPLCHSIVEPMAPAKVDAATALLTPERTANASVAASFRSAPNASAEAKPAVAHSGAAASSTSPAAVAKPLVKAKVEADGNSSGSSSSSKDGSDKKDKKNKKEKTDKKEHRSLQQGLKANIINVWKTQ